MTQTMDPPQQTKAIARMPDLREPPQTLGRLSGILMMPDSKKRISEVLPAHVKVEWLARMVNMAVSRNGEILQCTAESIMRAVMEAGSLGLNPSGGTLGEAYLVPFNNKVKGTDRWEKTCTLMIGYRGLIVLARRSNEVADVDGDVVYKNDHFIYRKGLNPQLEHTPNYEATREDQDIVGAWSLWRLKGGESHFKFVPRADIEKRRKVSKSGSDKQTGAPIGMWKNWYPEMCIKTALRITAKLVPASSEDLARALTIEDQREEDANVESAETRPAATTGTESTKAKLMQKPLDDGKVLDISDSQELPDDTGDTPMQSSNAPKEEILVNQDSQTKDVEPPEKSDANDAPDAWNAGRTYNEFIALVRRHLPTNMPTPEEGVVRFEEYMKLHTKGFNKMGTDAKKKLWSEIVAKDAKFYLAD